MRYLMALMLAGLTTLALAADEKVELKTELDDHQQKISLRFPYDMVSWPMAATRAVDPKIAPSAKPRLHCQWEWISEREMQCISSGDKQLKRATNYELVVPPQHGLNGQWLRASKHAFETRRPTLSYVIPEWSSAQNGMLSLYFSDAVLLESFGGKIALISAENKQRIELPNWANKKDDKSKRQFETALPLGLVAGISYTLNIDEGILPVEGVLPMHRKTGAHILVAPPALSFIGLDCVSKNENWRVFSVAEKPAVCTPQAGVKLWFSNKLQVDSVEAIRTALGAESVYQDSWEHVEGGAAKRLAMIHLRGLRSNKLNRINQMSVQDVWNRTLRLNEIQFNTLPYPETVQASLKKDRYFPAEPIEIPMKLINASSLNIELEYVDRNGLQHQMIRWPVPGFTADEWLNVTLPLHEYLPKTAALVRGTIKSAADLAIEQFEFSRTALDIHAKTLDGQLVGWVSDKINKNALANSRVELFAGGDFVVPLAQGKTDHNGSFQLTLPNVPTNETTRNDNRKQHMWLRINNETNTGVFPLSWWADSAEWDSALKDRGELYMREGDHVVWGVTDKHLYSAGEQVNYRLFVRQRSKQRLLCSDFASALNIAVLEEEEQRVVIDGGAITLDEHCSASGQFQLPVKLNHGNYHVLVRHKSISSEDFYDGDSDSPRPIQGRFVFEVANPKPPTINVTLSAAQSEWAKTEKTFSYFVNVGYFSGGPLPRAETEIISSFSAFNHNEIDPRTEKFPSYVFEIADSMAMLNEPGYEEIKKIKTDRIGQINLVAKRPTWLPGLSLWRADAEVKGEDGQTYFGVMRPVVVATADYFAGLKLNAWWVRAGDSIDFNALVVDRKSVMAEGKAVDIELWQIDREKQGLARRKKLMQHCSLVSALQAMSCDIKAANVGHFELVAKVASGTDEHQASKTFYVYPKTGHASSNDDDDELILESDKTEYRVGDTAKLRLLQPFSSTRALLTIERDRLLHSEWLLINGNEHTFDVPITAAMQNGATVALQLFDVENTEDRWQSALRTSIALKVHEPKPSQLIMSANKERYEPGDNVELSVAVLNGDGRGLMLSVVDSALLSLIDNAEQFFNPNQPQFLDSLQQWTIGDDVRPEKWVVPIPQAKPRVNSTRERESYALMEVSDADVIEVVGARTSAVPGIGQAREFGVVLPAESGDTAANRRAKIRNYFRQTAFWLPATTLDKQGKATIRFKLPDNLTQWTVLAFSYDKDDAFDFAKTQFTASLPLEVRLTAPEHVVIGDHIGVDAVIRNATSDVQNISAQLQVTDNQSAQTDSVTTRTLRLHGNDGETLSGDYKTSSTQRTAERLTWVASASSESGQDAVSAETAINLPIAPRTLIKTVSLPAQGSFDMTIAKPADAWHNDAHMSWRPIDLMTGVNESVRYMQAYPHLCWEQRTSRMMVAVLAQHLGESNPSQEWLQAAELKDWLLQMPNFQAPNGGFSYWRSENELVDLHLSLYTAQAFSRLRQLGWTLAQREEQRLRAFLAKRLTPENKRNMTDSARAMLFSVLPHGHDADAQRQTLLNNADKLTLVDKAYLLDAMRQQSAEAADMQRLRSLISRDASESFHFVDISKLSNSWLWRDSDQTTRCVVANVLANTAATPDETLYALKWLRGAQIHRESDGSFGSTNENAQCLWTVWTLRQQQKTADIKPAMLEMTWNNQSQRVDAEQKTIVSLAVNTALTIRNLAETPTLFELRFDYTGDTRLNERREVGMKINRQYDVFKNNRWQAVSASNVGVGDWIRVTLRITTPSTSNFVAVSDPVPGGLVAVDPEHDASVPVHRLGRTQQSYGFYHKQFAEGTARFYSDTLWSGEHTIQYFAKATTFGQYQALPAKVEMMYADDIYGTSSVNLMNIKTADQGSNH